MKLLLFQAKRFTWRAFSKTLDEVDDVPGDERRVEDAVVVFFHAEERDEDPERSASVFRKTLKQIKWIAGKRELKRVVLHSFTHLGGTNSSPEFASSFMSDLAERLRSTGYEVENTPFGYFCEWDLGVYGESLAKVWKEI